MHSEIQGMTHKQSIVPVVSLPKKDVKSSPASGIYSSAGTLSLKAKPLRSWAAVYFLALFVLFFKPLYNLARFSYFSDTYSHILLIPFLSGYLIWLKRKQLTSRIGSVRACAFPLLLGLLSLAVYGSLMILGRHLSLNDSLALITFSFVCLLVAGFGLLLGDLNVRTIAFPLVMLLFMAPFPEFFLVWIEKFLQHSSAEAAYALISLSGCPVFKDGLSFQLPSVSIVVSGECSGIRSSLVLLITSLFAGHLFLQSPWRRTVLALAVIPLAILRNGFRIFVIAMLCVHVDADMLYSWIHRRGGPLFFLLSLVPFFILLIFLRWSERHKNRVRSHV